MARLNTTRGSLAGQNGPAAVLLRTINPSWPTAAGKCVVKLVKVLDQTCTELLSALHYAGSIARLPSDTCVVTAGEAALIGLIIDEAVTNAVKYAHPTGVPGKITVECHHDDLNNITVDVVDDGVGFPENFDPRSDGSVGIRMMYALSERLGGALAFKSSSLGLGVSLRVPNNLALLAPPDAAEDNVEFGAFNAASARRVFTQEQCASKPSIEASLDLLQALPAAVYTTDAQGRINFYNEAAATLWGCRPALGKDKFCGSWKLYWPDGTPLPHDECPMALALRQKEAIRGVEAVAQRPDGTRIPFLPYPTPLFDNSGAVVGAINLLVDISERKRAEALMAKHRDEQAALYQLTNNLFRASSLSGVCDAALDAIRKALGCERASILLFNEAGVMRFVAWRGLSAKYRKAVEGHSPWARSVKEPQPVCIQDVDAADLSESLRAVVRAEKIEALAFIPLVVNGELIGKFMTYYEVPHVFSDTEVDLAVTVARQLGFGIARLRADQASHLLASIIASSHDAIVSKDLNGIVTSWNRGAERVFGYNVDEMVGKPITTLIPADRHDEEPAILERVRSGERVDHYETVRLRKDGSLVDISLSVSPVKDVAGHVIGAAKIARDISERKQAQARQELLTREIQHRTKNLFAVVLAVVSRSFVGKYTVKDAEAAVVSRLRSLGQTHVMLIDQEWQGADLAEIVRAEMSPYAGRVQIEGPPLMLTAQAAQNFALALHELATNAAKYGALSNVTGRVHISWSEVDGSTRFTFCWQERGGPPVWPPTQQGFGSTVLEQVMAEYFDVPPRMDFAIEGLCYELNGSLKALKREQHATEASEPG